MRYELPCCLILKTAIATALVAIVNSSAFASTTYTGSNYGDWTVYSNWSNGVPNASTDYTYITSSNVRLSSFVLDFTNIPKPYNTGAQFDLSGGSLTIYYNGRLQSDHVNIGANAGQTASVTITDSLASWTTSDIYVANGGTGVLTLENGAALSAGNGLYIAYQSGSVGTLNIGDYAGYADAGSLAGGGVHFGSGTGKINFNQKNNFTLAAPIDGNGAIIQRGSGATMLSGDNSGFTGTIAVDSGRLQIDTTSKLSSTYAGALSVNGGSIFQYSSASDSILTGSITGGGTLLKDGTGKLTLTGNKAVTGDIQITNGTLLANGTNSPSAGIGASSSVTVSNAVLQSGGTDNGLFGSGGTTGVLTLGAGGVLNTSSDTTTNHISRSLTFAGGTLGGTGALSGSSFTYGRWNLDQGVIVQAGSNQTSTISSLGVAMTQSGGTQFAVNASGASSGIDLDVTGQFYQAGGGVTNTNLVKSGGGVMRLSGANNYTSNTLVTAGILQFGKTNSFYSSNSVSSSNAAKLIVSSGAMAAFNTGGPGEFAESDINTLRSASKGGVGFLDGAKLGLDTTNAGSISFGSDISDTNNGSLGLVKLGAGTLILTGNNTYTGGTTITAGTLQIGSGGASGTISGNISNNGALVFNRNNITFNGSISGTGTLTKSGSATLTLIGNNTYTGSTAINGGTLLIYGSLGNSATTVPNGCTLGGIGTMGGTVTVQNGGTLAPGLSGIGTLTINNSLTLAGTTTMEVLRTGSALSSDRVSGLSAITYGGALVVNNIGPLHLGFGNSFQLFSAASYAGSFSSITLPPLGFGLVWDTSRLSVDGTIFVDSANGFDEVPNILVLGGNISPAPGHGTAGGPPDDAILSTFSVPATDDTGSLAVVAKWNSKTGGKGTGLFLHDSFLAKVGGDASTAVGVTGATWKSFADPVIDNREVVCLATVSGVPKASSSVILHCDSNGTNVVARAGDAATADGAKFKSFKSAALSNGTVGFLANLVPGSGAAPKITAANDVGLWISEQGNASVLILREGQQIGGKTIKTLISFGAGDGSPGQGRGWLTPTEQGDPRVLALCLFTDQSQGVVQVDSLNLGNAVIVSESGQAGVTGPDVPNATFASFGLPASNAFGQTAFRATLRAGTGGVLASNASGIFADFGTDSNSLVARVGDPAGSTGATFSVLRDPVLANDGGLAFPATIKGGAGKGAAASTLWWLPPGGSLKMLAQSNGACADLPGAHWKSFPSLAIAANRGPIFTATLVVGLGVVTNATATGVWACDTDGVPRLLFRAGDQIPLAHGVTKTLKSFTLLNANVGSVGVTRSLNNQLQVAWLATFKEDNSQAVFITDIP